MLKYIKKIKKSISLLLALSMLFSFSPIYAEDEEYEPLAYADEMSTELPSVNGIIAKVKATSDISGVAQSLNMPSLNTFNLMGESFNTLEVSEDGTEYLTLIPVLEEDIPDVLSDLNENENVVYAQPNYRVTLSEIDINQWGLQNSGQSVNTVQGTTGYDINVVEAWNITQGSGDVVVGVVDSGIDINHEALAGKIWINPNEMENDGEGYIGDINGWDFVNNDNTVYDDPNTDEHGTHVAGIIANVAPNVKIMPLKAFSGNVGYTFDIINAINYAEAMGVKIINCSFAGTEYNTALADVMELSEMIFVCAAGNYARSTDELSPFPACYGFPNILSVAAIDNTGMLSPISTYGDKIDIAAPGINIYSTLPDNQYGFKDGTSMSTAYASGAVALVLSNNSSLTSEQLRQTIKDSSTTPVIMPSGVTETENLLDIFGALEYDLPEIPERTHIAPSLENIEDEKDDSSQYPFNFELENGELTLILDHAEAYQTVAVSVIEKTDDKNAAVLLNEDVDTTQTTFGIEDFLIDTDYVFNIKFNNNGLIENYIGDLKVYFSSESNTNVVNFSVAFSDRYPTEEYEGGDFTLMANRTEVEQNSPYLNANYTADDDNMTGKINPSGDVDWYYVSFSTTGVANFFVDVPTGCDFDLDLYDSNGTTQLDHSWTALDADELIRHYPVTAGKRYYIKIYGYQGSYSSSSAYTLRAKWHLNPDEYDLRNTDNDTFKNAASVSANTIINANINNIDDVDFFKFTISSTQYVNIVLHDMPFDYDMQIYNGASESYRLATSQRGTDDKSVPYNEVYSASLPAGTYYVKVYPYRSYSSTNYKLTITTGRDTLGLNNPYYHNLNAFGNRFYSFSLSQARLMYIEMTTSGSNDFDFYVYKKETTTNLYVEVDRAYTGNNPENLSLNLTSGDYLVWVNRYSGTGSYYDISTFSTTTVTSFASEMSLSGFPSDMMAGEQKTVTVTVRNLGSTVWTRSANIVLYDHTGNSHSSSFTTLPIQLSSSEKIGFGQTKRFTFTITAPNSSTSSKDYTLGFAMYNGAPFGVGKTAPITVTSFTNWPTSGSPTVSGTYEKMYRLDLSTGNHVFRTLYTSANSNTVLTLYNSSLTQIAYNDNIYSDYPGSKFSRIERNITSAGVYYLKVSGYNGAVVSCQISVNTYSDTTLISSANVNNQLEGFYRFTPQTSGTYTFATSKYIGNADTYIFLLNSSGTVLKHNDNGSGMGLYSSVTESLTGQSTYYIRVSSFQYANSGRNTNVTCSLSVGNNQSSSQPQEPGAAPSITIDSPTGTVPVKVYNGGSIKISGTSVNVGTVSVRVDGNLLSGVKKNGNTFEASFTPNTSKSYTIQASATGTFTGATISASKTIVVAINDDGDDTDTATELKEGTERVAAIDFAGDIDYFSIKPSKTGNYIIDVSGISGLKIELINLKQGTIGTLNSNSQITKNLSSAETYYLKVKHSSGTQTGAYKIKVAAPETNKQDAYEPNNDISHALKIEKNIILKGLNLHEKSDIDYYKFDIDDTSNVTVDLYNIPQNCNYNVQILDSNNISLVTSTSSVVTTKTVTKNSLTAGTYYIKITSSSGYSNQNYILKVVSTYVSTAGDTHENNNSFSTASNIALTPMQNMSGGVLTYIDGTIHVPTDVDWYKFTITPQQVTDALNVPLRGFAIDLSTPERVYYDMALYDVNQNLIDVSVADYDSMDLKNIYIPMVAGTYYIKLYPWEAIYSSREEYRIRLTSAFNSYSGGERYGWATQSGKIVPSEGGLTYRVDASMNANFDNENSYSNIFADAVSKWNSAGIDGAPGIIFAPATTGKEDLLITLSANGNNGRYAAQGNVNGTNMININSDLINSNLLEITKTKMSISAYDFAVSILMHELGHYLGLKDLYMYEVDSNERNNFYIENGILYDYKDFNDNRINNRNKLMYGKAEFQDTTGNLNFLNEKDIEGVRLFQNWPEQNSIVSMLYNEHFGNAGYLAFSKTEAISSADIIVEGTVREVENLNINGQPKSRIKLYVKDVLNGDYNDEYVYFLQDGNSDYQYYQNPILTQGKSYILCLEENENDFTSACGPYGIFGIEGNNGEFYTQSHYDNAMQKYTVSEEPQINLFSLFETEKISGYPLNDLYGEIYKIKGVE